MPKPADAAFVARLAVALPDGVVREAEPRHIEEPRGRWHGAAGCLAVPATVDQVATIVRHCAAAGVAVVPWGGGTGLVGGQLGSGLDRPVILSLERFRAVRGLWPAENCLIAEAGVTLASVREAAASVGRLFPLSLASEGSATIGGNLATNAGGVNVLRYGNARDLCLGLEAVLADGSIWHGLKRLRKDNTGYDLRNLLVGSEGTLGIITAAVLRLVPVPAGQGVALMVVQSPAAALRLLELTEAQIGGAVSAFELMNGVGFDFLSEKLPEVRQPFATVPEWSVLIDIGLPAGLVPEDMLSSLFEMALSAGLVSDGVIATSGAQRASLWALRESIPEANRRIGAVSSHDISVPLSALPEFIERARPALGRIGDWRINCFGHLGDGNLHYNVFPQAGRTRADHESQRDEIKSCVHDLVHELGGSVSAEHGIGRLKVADLERYGDPAKLTAMRAIKHALDPKGILNPGAVMRA